MGRTADKNEWKAIFKIKSILSKCWIDVNLFILFGILGNSQSLTLDSKIKLTKTTASS